jgi:DNA-binding MarR family transcriptional regulator
LDLFVRQHSGLNTGVSSACHASFSPVTTALRHITILTERNIIVRRFDPRDQRRVYLELTEETKQEIQRILLTDDCNDLEIAS